MKQICAICGKEFEGYGNNAEPVLDGICCDKCNQEVVLPKRLEELIFYYEELIQNDED